MTWELERHVNVQASYGHFLTGSYVHQAAGGDVNYFSTHITFFSEWAANSNHQPVHVAIHSPDKTWLPQGVPSGAEGVLCQVPCPKRPMCKAPLCGPIHPLRLNEYGILRSFAMPPERDTFNVSPL